MVEGGVSVSSARWGGHSRAIGRRLARGGPPLVINDGGNI